MRGGAARSGIPLTSGHPPPTHTNLFAESGARRGQAGPGGARRGQDSGGTPDTLN